MWCADFSTPVRIYWKHKEQKRQQESKEEEKEMKGYNVESGYMGLVRGRYMLFASEEDYREYLEG